MKLTCSKERLLESLNLVIKSVSSRTTLPILECVLVSADSRDGGGFQLLANDLEMGIETAFVTAEVDEPGNIALDAKVFMEIVRKMPSAAIYLETDSNSVTRIISGKSELKILGMPGDEFPFLPVVEKSHAYAIKASELKEMIRQTIFSVAVEETKPILTGELLQMKGGSLRMVSVDGFRISYRSAEIEQTGEDIGVVVPAKALNELSRILPSDGEEEVKFYFTDKHILFEMEAGTMVSRLLDGEFIKYDQVFNNDFTTIVNLDKRELLSSLERAILISRDTKKNPVRLTMGQDAVVITSTTEMGTSYDEIPADIDGSNMEIGFNPRFLIDALRVIEDERILIQFTTPLSPCIIKGVEGENYKYLILPLRLPSRN